MTYVRGLFVKFSAWARHGVIRDSYFKDRMSGGILKVFFASSIIWLLQWSSCVKNELNTYSSSYKIVITHPETVEGGHSIWNEPSSSISTTTKWTAEFTAEPPFWISSAQKNVKIVEFHIYYWNHADWWEASKLRWQQSAFSVRNILNGTWVRKICRQMAAAFQRTRMNISQLWLYLF